MLDIQLDTKKEIGERFKQLYKKLGLTQLQLAEIIDSEQEAISMAVTGKRYVQEVWLYKLREKYNTINIEWVLTGEPPMFFTRIILPEGDYPLLSAGGAGIAEEPSMRLELTRELDKEELQKLVLRLVYRVEELERRVGELEGRVTAGNKDE